VAPTTSAPFWTCDLKPEPARDPAALLERLEIDVPRDLLLESLTHRSYAYENGGLVPNERLEFLGDAVLGLVITDALFDRNPGVAEGELAKMRASIVSSKALGQVAREISLGEYLLLGKGELTTGGRNKTSILADATEALIGATYIGCGLAMAEKLIMRLFEARIRASEELGAGLDWKTSLQELSSQLDLGVPAYVVTGEGPDHDRIFTARVRLRDGLHGFGRGETKKEAEQQAAKGAFAELNSDGVREGV